LCDLIVYWGNFREIPRELLQVNSLSLLIACNRGKKRIANIVLGPHFLFCHETDDVSYTHQDSSTGNLFVTVHPIQ